VQGWFVLGGQDGNDSIVAFGTPDTSDEHGADEFELPSDEPGLLLIVVGDDDEVGTADLDPRGMTCGLVTGSAVARVRMTSKTDATWRREVERTEGAPASGRQSALKVTVGRTEAREVDTAARSRGDLASIISGIRAMSGRP
jgi:hypothetical protein